MTLQAPPLEETWDLEALFESVDAFDAEREAVGNALAELDAFPGTAASSPQRLAEILDSIDRLAERYTLLRSYASMKSDEDATDAASRTMRQRTELLGTEFSRKISFLRPELLRMTPETVERFLDSEPELARHRHFLCDLMRQRAHVLEPGEERILAESGLMMGSASSVFGVLNNAELPRPEFTRPDGEVLSLTPVNVQKIRQSSNTDERRSGFPIYLSAYSAFRETFAQNLYATVKSDLFRTRARRYENCLAAAMAPDNVPATVYENLIANVRKSLPGLHRYFDARRRALDLEFLDYADLHCPLSRSEPRRYSIAEARALVVESMRPLGSDYASGLQKAFDDRWIDWHPRDRKRAGAYASGWAYRLHPYILVNFIGDYDSVSTLTHELGHAMHSYFSNRAQPYATHDYTIFVAEVASTLNETLLNRRMLETASSPDERIFLLASQLDGIRGTLFRQTMFAEFELEIHRRVEAGETLTGESLDQLYLGLLRDYHGHDAGHVQVDEAYAVEWAAIPHFHYNFYVYQYATGITAAHALAAKLISGDRDAIDRYLAFLSSGGSDYPLELLRRAGVDLETPEPYQAVLRSVSTLVDALDTALAQR